MFNAFAALLLAGAGAGAAAAAAAADVPAAPAVDLHCHVAGIGAGGSGCYASPRLRANFRYRFDLKAFGVKEAELKVHGDDLVVTRLADRLAGSRYVGRAVVLALDGVVDARGNLDLEHTELYVPNEFVRRAIATCPNLLYGASVNPYRTDALARLTAEADNGAVLFKLIPNIQLIDMSDPGLAPYFKRIRDLGKPLLVHTGDENSFTVSREELGDPDRLRLALDCGLTVIAAHAGGSGKNAGKRNLDRLMALVPRYPNLYIDVSALTTVMHAGHLRRLLRHPEALDRLVYGSDTPLPSTPIHSPWFSVLRIGPAKAWRIARNKNPWDRDVLHMRALGLPEAAFQRSAEVLRLPLPAGPGVSRRMTPGWPAPSSPDRTSPS